MIFHSSSISINARMKKNNDNNIVIDRILESKLTNSLFNSFVNDNEFYFIFILVIEWETEVSNLVP